VLLINLMIIAVGFSALWKRKPILPLMLVLTYIVYNLSSAIVRLSGWRFVQPVDWFVYIFFIAGVVEIIGWLLLKIPLFRTHTNPNAWDAPDGKMVFDIQEKGKIIISSLVFILACGFIPLRQNFLPAYYPDYDRVNVCDEVKGYIEESQYQEWGSKLHKLCISGDATVYKGIGIYPRFFDNGEGYYDRSRDKFYGEQDYSRLVFRIVGELNGKIYVKTDDPSAGINDGDLVYAIVENKNRVGAHVVIFPGAEPEVVLASDIISGDRPFISE